MRIRYIKCRSGIGLRPKNEESDMGTQSKKQPQVVPSLAESLGSSALPYHNARSPFKRSEGRNRAWQILQDAGKTGISKVDWLEKLTEAGIANPLFYANFVVRAKRRVVVTRLENGNYVAVAPGKPREKKQN